MISKSKGKSLNYWKLTASSFIVIKFTVSGFVSLCIVYSAGKQFMLYSSSNKIHNSLGFNSVHINISLFSEINLNTKIEVS